MKKLLIPFFLLGLLLNACKKDDAAAIKPSENPVASLVNGSGWKISTRNNGAYEVGYVFSASAKGKITQVGSQMGDPGNYILSIWDVDTKKLLRQKNVEQASPNKFSVSTVDDLVIEKDKKYLVSINNTSNGSTKLYSVLEKTPASSTTIFPISSGNIVIQKSVYSASSVPVFPTIDYSSTNGFYGFADITFVPD